MDNQAIVTQRFNGAPDGEIYPRAFNPGDEISGSLAKAAIEAGWARPLIENRAYLEGARFQTRETPEGMGTGFDRGERAEPAVDQPKRKRGRPPKNRSDQQ